MPNLASQFSVPVYALYDSNGNLLGLYGANGGAILLTATSLATLPTTPPVTHGIIWNDGGVLSIS